MLLLIGGGGLGDQRDAMEGYARAEAVVKVPSRKLCVGAQDSETDGHEAGFREAPFTREQWYLGWQQSRKMEALSAAERKENDRRERGWIKGKRPQGEDLCGCV